MDDSPRTRYANCHGIDIAYQVLGQGTRDILLITGGNIPIDCMDEDPAMARFLRRLSGFGRLIRFDRRGVGQSDRGSPAHPPEVQDWVDDAIAVMDAVGSDRATVIAPLGATPDGVVMADTHPERVTGLILVNGSARMTWAPDYPHRVVPEQIELLNVLTETDAVEQGMDFLAHFAPSVANDPAFRAWFDRAGNLGATPAMARAMVATRMATDIREILPRITVPTLVIQRAGLEEPLEAAHGRYLAEHIPGATYAELDGSDIFFWTGDANSMLDEIEEFMTGRRGSAGTERVLATLLFTDLVGSTDLAAQLGDGAWHTLLDRHDRTVRHQLERFGGHEVKAMGDGFVATFDSPGRAIQCAEALRDALGSLNLQVRAGIHTGEIEVRGSDVAGLAVHIGARVSALAGAGEILVSSTVRDLVAGSTAEFSDREEHELKGVPGRWRLYLVSGHAIG